MKHYGLIRGYVTGSPIGILTQRHKCARCVSIMAGEGVSSFSTTVSRDDAKTTQLCRVCGEQANGNHFGVLSCEACKSFFRRSVRVSSQYACRGARNCLVTAKTRNRCPYCRLQKCLAVGMRLQGACARSWWEGKGCGAGFVVMCSPITLDLVPSNLRAKQSIGIGYFTTICL